MLIRVLDPEVLKRAHVVVCGGLFCVHTITGLNQHVPLLQITSYSSLASEHATFSSNTEVKDASKSKGKKDSNDDEGESFGSDDSLTKAIKKRAPAAKGGKKKPPMDALFRLNWWRIVLGMV